MTPSSHCLPAAAIAAEPRIGRPWQHLLHRLREAHARWQRQRASAACLASLRGLPRHTLRDIGLGDFS